MTVRLHPRVSQCSGAPTASVNKIWAEVRFTPLGDVCGPPGESLIAHFPELAAEFKVFKDDLPLTGTQEFLCQTHVWAKRV